MSRYVQPVGTRGSLKWIQRAINRAPDLLDDDILKATKARTITWLSPLEADAFAEYRDAAFLERLGAADLAPMLADAWPSLGPQWDALGRTDRGDLLLVEAKAHVSELLSPGTQSVGASRLKIETTLSECAQSLNAKPLAPWADTLYQLTNRLAHLWLLRRAGKPAWLVLVNFLDDADVDGPHSHREWEAAYEVAWHVLGVPRQHALSRYILHLYPRVTVLADTA